ncbi:MAG: hypothetical protein VX670_11885, partial [Candidatus Latescibacterota bacterium]|nr:hypothetical protein [Candidatus Latescibacterota bacterium]
MSKAVWFSLSSPPVRSAEASSGLELKFVEKKGGLRALLSAQPDTVVRALPVDGVSLRAAHKLEFSVLSGAETTHFRAKE